MIQGLAMHELKGKTIIEVKFGSKETPKCGSYGAYTIIVSTGQEYVIWNSMGEINLSEVVK